MKYGNLRRLGEKIRIGSEEKTESTATLDVRNSGTFEIRDIATIGRASDSHIVVNDHSVSRHHARIFYESGHFWIKDLDSANGTILNGKKISLQMLKDNDKIAFGEATAVFHTSSNINGPALIGSDPLEGTDPSFQDGTPTGGLTAAEAAAAELFGGFKFESNLPAARSNDKRVEAIPDKRIINREYKQSAEEYDNISINEDGLLLNTSSSTSTSPEQENERLRKLVKQLERALADSNLRLRNLQELLERKKD
jgi:pSer/pThr/pTyr-binding forkhead associated (FHA) protein